MIHTPQSFQTCLPKCNGSVKYPAKRVSTPATRSVKRTKRSAMSAEQPAAPAKRPAVRTIFTMLVCAPLLCAALLFTGCGQAGPTPAAGGAPALGSTPAPGGADAPAPLPPSASAPFPAQPDTSGAENEAAAGSLTLVTGQYGANNEAAGKDGFYKLCPIPGGGANLLYVDYASRSMIVLCSRPDCLHRDESCPAWFSVRAGGIFMDAAQDTLFCIEVADPDAHRPDTIWQMEPDGANRRLFYQCAAHESIADAIASDAGALYFTVSSANIATASAEKVLLRADLQTGETRALQALGSSEWLSGVCGDRLILLSFQEDGTARYMAYAPSDGTQTELYRYQYDFDRPDSKRVCCNDGFFYIFSPTGDDTAQLLKLNITSGDTAVLCEGFPWYGAEFAFIQGFYDDHLIIDISDVRANDPAKVHHYRYFIDCNTGVYTECSLTYAEGFYFVTIAAETPDAFVVSKGIQSIPILITGTGGDVYESSLELTEYALLSKPDYWNSVPNYEDLNISDLIF